MKVLLCQLDLAWEDPAANFDKVRQLLAGRDDLQGALIVLPEMLATGFSMDVATVTDREPAQSETFLAGLAVAHGATLVAGCGAPAESPRKGRNLAVAIGADGSKVAEYAKIHPFSYGGEAEHYEAGEAVVTFDWHGLSVCPLICYDLRFPETFRDGVGAGAELFCVIANWPAKRIDHWVTLLRARAIENQAYVVGVNRCGHDPNFTYPGRSLVVDPHGEIIADAAEGEGLVTCEIDPRAVRDWRATFPALRDRRVSPS